MNRCGTPRTAAKCIGLEIVHCRSLKQSNLNLASFAVVQRTVLTSLDANHRFTLVMSIESIRRNCGLFVGICCGSTSLPKKFL